MRWHQEIRQAAACSKELISVLKTLFFSQGKRGKVDVAPGENDAQPQWAAVGPWRNLHRREHAGELIRFDFFDAFVMRGL